MSETPNDPAGSTQQFQQFQQAGAPAEVPKSGVNVGLIAGIVAVVVLVAVVAAALLI